MGRSSFFSRAQKFEYLKTKKDILLQRADAVERGQSRGWGEGWVHASGDKLEKVRKKQELRRDRSTKRGQGKPCPSVTVGSAFLGFQVPIKGPYSYVKLQSPLLYLE